MVIVPTESQENQGTIQWQKKNGLWAIENNSCPLTNGLDSTEENNSPSYNSPRKSGIVVWARRLVAVQKVS